MSNLLHNLTLSAAILATAASAPDLAEAGVTELTIVGPKPSAAASAGRAVDACSLIRTAEELSRIRHNPGGHYCLANEIDLAGIENFNPIPFDGVFDGRGHRILNLTINRPRGYDVGLFSTVTGTVKNLGIVNASGSTTLFVPGSILTWRPVH